MQVMLGRHCGGNNSKDNTGDHLFKKWNNQNATISLFDVEWFSCLNNFTSFEENIQPWQNSFKTEERYEQTCNKYQTDVLDQKVEKKQTNFTFSFAKCTSNVAKQTNLYLLIAQCFMYMPSIYIFLQILSQIQPQHWLFTGVLMGFQCYH